MQIAAKAIHTAHDFNRGREYANCRKSNSNSPRLQSWVYANGSQEIAAKAIHTAHELIRGLVV
jgi:hypothetical protein